MNDPYRIVLAGGTAETELKKSRFIAHVEPVSSEEEAQAFVNSIKKQYYDARHNCYAYVIGKDADRVKYSDDGEPSQTAGLPMYNILKETGIKNVCVVVTRYFGGTLLGAGPLARMYAEACKLGLEAASKAWMRYGAEVNISSDYPDGEKIRRYLEKEGITVTDVLYTDKVETLVRCAFEDFEKLSRDIISLTASKAKIQKTGEGYFVDKEA